MKTFSTMPNEITPILATDFLRNEWWNIDKKNLACPFLKHLGEARRDKKKQERLLQSFLP